MSKPTKLAPSDSENFSVTISRDEAQQITDLLELISGKLPPAGRGVRSHAVHSSGPCDRRIEMARRTYLARRARSRFFTRSISGEPAWDMLLALYSSDAGQRGHTTTEISELSAATPTTALRWLDYLVGQGLVLKAPSPFDRRITTVRLSPQARQALDAYFTLLEQEGLGD